MMLVWKLAKKNLIKLSVLTNATESLVSSAVYLQTIRTSLYSGESGIKESKGFDQNKSISDYNKKLRKT